MSAVPGLTDKVDEVVKAAIAAEMSEYGYYGNCEDGFEGYSAPTEGSTANPVTITYPDGQILEYGHIPTDVAKLNGGVDPKAVFAKWDQVIRMVFHPWGDLPDPTDFEEPLATLSRAASGVAVGGVTLDGDGAETTVAQGNTDLHSLVRSVIKGIGEFKGDPFSALAMSYLNRLDVVLSGQSVMTTVLYVGMRGEQEIWKRVREIDILDVAEKAREAFEYVAVGGGGSLGALKPVFEVLGAVASVVSIFGGKVANGVSVAIGIVNTFLPDPPKRDKPDLAADSTDGVFTNLQTALSELSSSVAGQEHALRQMTMNAGDSLYEHIDHYDFGVPSDFLHTTEETKMFAKGEDLQVLIPFLRGPLAGRVEGVSLIVGAVQRDLGSLPGSGPWKRNGTIGLGPEGHYFAWDQLHGELVRVMGRSESAMGRVADQMVLVSYDFDRTEEQITTELQRHVRNIPDPTPRESQPYGLPETVTT